MTTHDPDPDDSDGLTARLRAQPPAALPAHWRAEILAAARRALPLASPPEPRLPALLTAWTAWMWPHPRACAALAVVWLVIVTLRLLTPAALLDPPSPGIAARSTHPETPWPLLGNALLASRESAALAIETRP